MGTLQQLRAAFFSINRFRERTGIVLNQDPAFSMMASFQN
jgi:hypothetical protein